VLLGSGLGSRVDGVPTTGSTGSAGSAGSRLGYLPALDGLRAVSVGAVFLFHAGVVSGGFVGVDVFFVISGFLITGLALVEIEDTGRLSLGGFWSRRARRLLPALFVLCAAVVVHAAVVGDGAARRVGRDVIGALAYVSNWTQLGAGRSYFARYEEPSLLEHTWSLAVEEQFYVVWPLLLVAVAALCRRRGTSLRRAVGTLAVVSGVASAAWAAWLASRDVDLGRIYYGTDTRAVGFAAGAAVACVLGRRDRTGERKVGRNGTLAGVASAGLLTGAAVLLDGSERWLYGPGFALIALASLILTLVCAGTGPIAGLLSWSPLVAIGKVSYGIYLWHWPVIVVLDTERTGLSGLPLGVCWVGVTALLTVASWVLVERRVPRPVRQAPWRSVAYAATAVVVAVAAVVVVDREERNRPAVVLPPPVAGTAMSDPTTAAPPPTAPPLTTPAPKAPPLTTPAPTVPAPTVPPDRPLRLLVLGDSVAVSIDGGTDETVVVNGLGEVTVRNEGLIACSVVTDGRWTGEGVWELDDPEACARPDRFAAAVEAFAPDVTFLLFGWPGVGGGRRLEDGRTISPCDPEFDRRWIEELSLVVDRLAPMTAVVVSNVAPPVSDDPAFAAPSACLNATLAGLTVPVYDYAGWICPERGCPGGEVLRPDSVHFDVDDDTRRAIVTNFAAEALAAVGYMPGTA
jgi:peptidoglycan/LPS O-acetylase OafA/YrhL